MGNKLRKNRNYLTDENLNILHYITALDRSEILQWYGEFKKESKNGELNKKHFISFYRQLAPKNTNVDKFSEFVFNGNFYKLLWYFTA